MHEETVIIEETSTYELERGKPMPSLNHARIEMQLMKVLLPYEDKYDILPELSLKLSTGDAVPDLCIYPKRVFDFENDQVKVTEAPLTTIEILSPKQVLDDVVKKIRDIYLPAGVKSSWVVIPSLKTIHILTPDKQVRTFQTTGAFTDPATGIELKMEEVFR